MEHFKDTKMLNNILYYLTYTKIYIGIDNKFVFMENVCIDIVNLIMSYRL